MSEDAIASCPTLGERVRRVRDLVLGSARGRGRRATWLSDRRDAPRPSGTGSSRGSETWARPRGRRGASSAGTGRSPRRRADCRCRRGRCPPSGRASRVAARAAGPPCARRRAPRSARGSSWDSPTFVTTATRSASQSVLMPRHDRIQPEPAVERQDLADRDRRSASAAAGRARRRTARPCSGRRCLRRARARRGSAARSRRRRTPRSRARPGHRPARHHRRHRDEARRADQKVAAGEGIEDLPTDCQAR